MPAQQARLAFHSARARWIMTTRCLEMLGMHEHQVRPLPAALCFVRVGRRPVESAHPQRQAYVDKGVFHSGWGKRWRLRQGPAPHFHHDGGRGPHKNAGLDSPKNLSTADDEAMAVRQDREHMVRSEYGMMLDQKDMLLWHNRDDPCSSETGSLRMENVGGPPSHCQT